MEYASYHLVRLKVSIPPAHGLGLTACQLGQKVQDKHERDKRCKRDEYQPLSSMHQMLKDRSICREEMYEERDVFQAISLDCIITKKLLD